MPKYTQAGRPLRIHTPLGDDQVFLLGLEGDEGVSTLFHFKLRLVRQLEGTTTNDQPIPFGDLLGKSVTIEVVSLEATRIINGIVSLLSEGDSHHGFVHYEMEVVPQLWLLQHRVQSRIFQWAKVPDILKQVLQPLDVDLRITGTYPEREYCVQYQESDFQFACRLMEEEGIYYFFEHSNDKHKLIVADADLPGQNSVAYVAHGNAYSGPRIDHWAKTQRLAAPKITVRDYHCLAPDKTKDLESSVTVSDKPKFGKVEHSLQAANTDKLEIIEFPGGYAAQYDAVGVNGGDDKQSDFEKIFQADERTVRLRGEEQAAQALRARGAGNCPQLAPGFKFTLAGHDHADGDYRMLHVRHEAANDFIEELPGHTGAFTYANRFECLPAKLAYRPPRLTHKHQIRGVQTAVVVTDGDNEITVDKHGRVKVKFHWDRRDAADLTCSSWLRVAQLWAGKKWGAYFWPRKGHEVVVAFVDGDPERPLIVGSVYNGVNLPPTAPVSDNAKVAGIRSRIFGGKDEDCNGFALYDAKGEEYTQIYSQMNDVQSARANRFEYVPINHAEFNGRLPF